MDEMKPYMKILVENMHAICAIYEPHPFRNCAIEEAIKGPANTGIADDAWCWVYYDWCGNPVGLSYERPQGAVVDKFTAENLGIQSLADYLNHENPQNIEAWNRRADDD